MNAVLKIIIILLLIFIAYQVWIIRRQAGLLIIVNNQKPVEEKKQPERVVEKIKDELKDLSEASKEKLYSVFGYKNGMYNSFTD